MTPDKKEQRAFQIYWILNIVRFMAIGFVMLGIAIANGKILGPGNEWVGFILAAIGLFEFFFMPNLISKSLQNKDEKNL